MYDQYISLLSQTEAYPNFITVEGMDGSGKSTQMDTIERELRGCGLDMIRTREPGGTPLGEALREMILNDDMDLETEVNLILAARCEHLRKVILPALEAGKVVLCDRFEDSMFAYQVARGYPEEKLRIQGQLVTGGVVPGTTLVFLVEPSVSTQRMLSRGEKLDRFEADGEPLQAAVYRNYERRIESAPSGGTRYIRIDANRPLAVVTPEVRTIARSLGEQLVASGYVLADSPEEVSGLGEEPCAPRKRFGK